MKQRLCSPSAGAVPRALSDDCCPGDRGNIPEWLSGFYHHLHVSGRQRAHGTKLNGGTEPTLLPEDAPLWQSARVQAQCSCLTVLSHCTLPCEAQHVQVLRTEEKRGLQLVLRCILAGVASCLPCSTCACFSVLIWHYPSPQASAPQISRAKIQSINPCYGEMNASYSVTLHLLAKARLESETVT